MKIKLLTPLNSTGVGTHGQCLSDALVKLLPTHDFELEIVPTGIVGHSVFEPMRGDLSKYLLTQRRIKPDVVVVLDVPSRIEHMTQSGQTDPSCPIVGYTVFETSKTPNDLDRYVDEIWVTSGWHRDQLLPDLLRADPSFATCPVKVVSEGTHGYLFNPIMYESSPSTPPKIINIGKFEIRKGHPMLLGALEDVHEFEMTAYWHNFFDPDTADECLRYLGYVLVERLVMGDSIYAKGNRKIIMKGHRKWWSQVRDDIMAADLAIYPHFGEGWGLPILDCLALGVPTIASCHTGSYEYMQDYYSYACQQADVNGRAEPPDPRLTRFSYEDAYGPFFPQGSGQWMKMNVEELSKSIETFLGLSHSDRQCFMTAGLATGRKYSWKASAECFLSKLGVTKK